MEQVIDLHMKYGELNVRWPGKVFRPGEDEFTALMGTDYGVGISWLLHDHRDIIKTKVTTITVFREGHCYYLRFDFG